MSVYKPPTASEIWALTNMVLELCWEIEKLPASPEQTALVSRAAAIHSALQDLLFDNCELRTEEPTRSGPRVIVGYSGPDPEESCFDEPAEPNLGCPHGRASWQMCPHCLELNAGRMPLDEGARAIAETDRILEQYDEAFKELAK